MKDYSKLALLEAFSITSLCKCQITHDMSDSNFYARVWALLYFMIAWPKEVIVTSDRLPNKPVFNHSNNISLKYTFV